MSLSYFNLLPNFEYVSRNYDEKNISSYTTTKNLFKRAKIRDDIFENVAFFERYNIIGDERPDNVAGKYYNDSTLDWLVLLSNNILDVNSEWPLPSNTFEKVMLNKYGSYDKLYSTHHYETIEVTNSLGKIVLPGGLFVSNLIRDYRVYVKDEFGEDVENAEYNKLVPYFIEYYDYGLGQEVLKTNIIKEVTNYDYEVTIDEKKRNIFLLKQTYIPVILDDLDNIMTYKQGSSQYITNKIKRGDNIRLYS